MKLCMIVATQNKDTILDRIAHEIGSAFDDTIYHYETANIPKADHYFVMHYTLLIPVMRQLSKGTRISAFFTHDKGSLSLYIEFFNQCHSVIAESPEGMSLLASLGVKPELLHFLPEGGDNEAFKPHVRIPDGSILICGTNYLGGRKNPEMIHKIIELIPQRRFLFVGKEWDEFEDHLNVEVINCSYQDYPKAFNQASVYLSCSLLEGGGPNSLIEAMHANLVSVVSDTGNAHQYIVDGYNGFIFPQGAEANIVVDLIEQAYKLQPQNAIPYADIWQTVSQHTWNKYSLNMKEIITDNYSLTTSQNLDEFDYESD